MAEAQNNLNPWVRANLEQFCPETLALMPAHLQEDYTRIMETLAHAKAIANLALEQMYLAEAVRGAFFEKVIHSPDEPGYPDNVIEFAQHLIDGDLPPLAA